MRREFSAGGVLFKDEEVLLIKNISNVWTFPKGNIERGEEPQETAIREVREETSVTGRVVTYIGSINYWYTLKGERVFKTVYYYLMEYVEGEPKPSWEVKDARFFPALEAAKIIKYRGDKEIYRKALGIRSTP